MTKLIGLTGGIATGKTTVSTIMRQAGIPVVDADQVARRVQAPNTVGLNQIAAAFGSRVLLPTGELNRPALAKIIFNNPAAREKLDEIMQPLIYDEIWHQINTLKKQRIPVIILDAPLLFEEGYSADCDLVVVVYTSFKTQLKRLMERNNYDSKTAEARINAQMNLAEKKARADILINNDGTTSQLQSQVADLIKSLKTN